MDPTQTRKPLPASPEREWQLQATAPEALVPPEVAEVMDPTPAPSADPEVRKRSWGRLALRVLFILFLTLAILLLWQGVAHA